MLASNIKPEALLRSVLQNMFAMTAGQSFCFDEILAKNAGVVTTLKIFVFIHFHFLNKMLISIKHLAQNILPKFGQKYSIATIFLWQFHLFSGL